MEYIRPSDTKELKLVGSKALNLMRLTKLDLKVPPFFCVTSDFLALILRNNQIDVARILDHINYDDEKSIKEGSQRIVEALKKVKVPDFFIDGLNEYLRDNFKNTKLFSVRSSSLIEDNETFSFAGQFETILNVKKQDLIPAILRCFASLYDANVLKYMNIHDSKMKALKEYKMSVIVEEMVNADASGVIFTSNPQGLINEAVIIHGKGTGNRVVEDKTSVTTYYYNKTDDLYYYEKRGASPLIKVDTLNTLLDQMRVIMRVFGPDLDIEYAIKKNEIYILQARAITTLNTKQLTILDNSNIVESYPHITLPLSASFARRAYGNVFTNLAKRIVKNDKKLKPYQPLLNSMVTSVNGRMYYQISNWYTLINFLPFKRLIIPTWQEMLGVNNKEVSYDKLKVPYYLRVRVVFRALKYFFKAPKLMISVNERFMLTNNLFVLKYHEKMSNKELLNLYRIIEKRINDDWDITLINDMYGFIYTGLLKKALTKLNGPAGKNLANNYLAGISDIESMKPIRELVKLASEVAILPPLMKELSKLKTNKAVKRYLQGKSSFIHKLNDYLDYYGDRSLEELKLESKTFRSDPILLIEEILVYAKDVDKLTSLNKTLFKSSQNKTMKLDHLPILKSAWLNYVSKRAVIGIRNREISRLNRSRMYGMVRTIYLGIAKNMVKAKVLEREEDIFYLTQNEISDYVAKKPLPKLKRIIKDRKAEYRIYTKLPTYSRLIFAGEPFNKNHQMINSVKLNEKKGAMLGVPCASGIVTGEVLVIDDAKEVKNAKNKILVTKMTDPGWVFLLTVAKGIITEKGSLLSHTAIISRELNIPSVVGVKNITNTLKTGDKITLNGNTGEITKL